ncbi:MAG: glycosyltransferase family protein [Actinomycetota bacterium]|nr:glycosyltransferase family protein [Actinomycetota bacterium]
MTTLAVLQARMSSTRLPGKAMLPLMGEPMLVRQLERIRRADRIDGIVIATSTDPRDDVIAELARTQGTGLVRGPQDDVLQRFVLAVEEFAPDVVVRLTADCPLASPAVIDAVIEQFGSVEADYCSNTLTPTFPDGLDAEVVRAHVLLDVAAVSTDPAEREHVTLGVYRRPDRYRLASHTGPRDLSSLRWTVDTRPDYEFVKAVYEELFPADPSFDVDAILELLERRPELNRTTADEARNAALAGLDTGAMHA